MLGPMADIDISSSWGGKSSRAANISPIKTNTGNAKGFLQVKTSIPIGSPVSVPSHSPYLSYHEQRPPSRQSVSPHSTKDSKANPRRFVWMETASKTPVEDKEAEAIVHGMRREYFSPQSSGRSKRPQSRRSRVRPRSGAKHGSRREAVQRRDSEPATIGTDGESSIARFHHATPEKWDWFT